MICTRIATIAELDQIKSIEDECFDRPWSRVLFEADLGSNPNAKYWVAFDDECPGELLGFIGTHNIVGEINITNVAVRQKSRGKGLGSLLINEMLGYYLSPSEKRDFALSKQRKLPEGIYGVTLEVRVSNRPAIGLYQKYGFVSEGVRKKYYSDGEDALIMWLR